MRNLLALVGLATVTFLGLGWYLGWYKIEKNSTSGQNNINLSLNTKRIGDDIQTGIQRGAELINSLSKSSSEAAPQNNEASWFNPAPAPTPTPAPNQTPWFNPAPKSTGWRPITPK